MRLTTAGLRSLIVNPASYIAAARMPRADSRGFGNIQRVWLEASLREYFANSRDEDALWSTFEARVGSRPPNPRRDALARTARLLLETFIEWDETEDDVPADLFPPIRDVKVGTHVIAVRRDLIYVDGPNYRCRQLWTNHDLPPRHPAAILMAAAVMLSVDHDLGSDTTTGVEAWGLRHHSRRLWTRGDLSDALQSLIEQLDDAAAAIRAV